MPRPRRTIHIVILGIAAGFLAIALMCAGVGYWTSLDRIKSGREYERQIADWPRGLVRDFPMKVPAGATGVRVYSDRPSVMPSPGHFIEIRFIGTAADVQAAIAAGKRGEGQAKQDSGWDARRAAEGLKSLDDGDRATPLAAGFQCSPLVVEVEDFAGVAVNPGTGEIVYWASTH